MAGDQTNTDDSLSVRQDNLLDTLPIYIATGIFLLTIVLATIQVLLRQLPIQIEILFWTEPLARYLLIVMTYLGTAIAVRNNENVKIDLLQRWLQKNQPYLYHVVTVLISLFVLFFVYAVLQGSLSSAQDSWSSGTNLPHVTYGMIHLTIVVSISLVGIYTLYQLVPYVKFTIAWLRGSDYSISTSHMISDETTAQLDEEEASKQAQDLMGLSDSSSTDDDNDDNDNSEETNTDSHEQSKRVIDDE